MKAEIRRRDQAPQQTRRFGKDECFSNRAASRAMIKRDGGAWSDTPGG